MRDDTRAIQGDRVLPVLASLSDALELDGERVTDTYRDMIRGLHAHEGPASEVAHHAVVRALSVSLARDRAALRLVVAPRSGDHALTGARVAALGMLAALEERYGAHLAGLRTVDDLFLTETTLGSFAAYVSVSFARGAPPTFATYLDPRSHGAARGPAVVEEALERLGLPHAWPALCVAALRRGPDLDEITHVALDLAACDPSVRVYVRHHAATSDDLIAACAPPRVAEADALHDMLRAITQDPRHLHGPVTCHTFAAEGARVASQLLIPTVARGVAGHDALGGVAAWLPQRSDIEGRRHQRVLRALEAWSGSDESTMDGWVALACDAERPEITLGVASQPARPSTRKTVLTTRSTLRAIAAPESVITWLMARPLGAHPLLQRIARIQDGAEAARRAAAARHMHEVFADLDPATDTPEAMGALVAGVVAVRLFETAAPPAESYADLLAIARLIEASQDATTAFARGAVNTHRMFWRAMDAAYSVAFPPHRAHEHQRS